MSLCSEVNLLFPTAPRGIAGIETNPKPTPNPALRTTAGAQTRGCCGCETQRRLSDSRERQHALQEGKRRSSEASPCPRDSAGAQTGPSTPDWGHRGQVFVGSGWALRSLGQAAAEVGESRLPTAFSSHRGVQDPGMGLSKTLQ